MKEESNNLQQVTDWLRKKWSIQYKQITDCKDNYNCQNFCTEIEFELNDYYTVHIQTSPIYTDTYFCKISINKNKDNPTPWYFERWTDCEILNNFTDAVVYLTEVLVTNKLVQDGLIDKKCPKQLALSGFKDFI